MQLTRKANLLLLKEISAEGFDVALRSEWESATWKCGDFRLLHTTQAPSANRRPRLRLNSRRCFTTIVYTGILWNAYVFKNMNCSKKWHYSLVAESRAGLTIGQTGQMPGASRFWGPRASIPKHSVTVFLMYSGWSPRVKMVQLFDYCV